MKVYRKLLERFGKAFIPRRLAPHLHEYLLKAGYMRVPYLHFGVLFYITIALTAALFFGFVYPYVIRFSFVILFPLIFFSWLGLHLLVCFLCLLAIYFYLDIRIFQRTQQLEKHLPLFLEQISSNLKGGMTFESALWKSIHERFGILAAETTELMKRVMTGTSTEVGLLSLSKKYNSYMLRRSVDLIVSELESGGDIARLLDRMVEDLEKTKELKEEMTASVVGYIIMISTIVVVVAPLLFALSFHLLQNITGFLSTISGQVAQSSIIKVNPATTVDPESFKRFSITSILTISLIASFVVSIIEKGHIKSGLKYIPIFVLGALGAYFIFLSGISSFFSF